MCDFILKQYGVKRYEEIIELSESFLDHAPCREAQFHWRWICIFQLQGIRTTRFTWLTWHLPSVFHVFPVSLDCRFFGKKSRLPKSLFAQFHRAAPHSFKTWCLFVYTTETSCFLHGFNHVFLCGYQICLEGCLKRCEANVYFLFVSIIVCLPDGPMMWSSTVVPFIGVLLWTAFKELSWKVKGRRGALQMMYK